MILLRILFFIAFANDRITLRIFMKHKGGYRPSAPIRATQFKTFANVAGAFDFDGLTDHKRATTCMNMHSQTLSICCRYLYKKAVKLNFLGPAWVSFSEAIAEENDPCESKNNFTAEVYIKLFPKSRN
ncbi:hypothetical protein FQR65_LT04413 [Abscondita terminalis]|nr:hypothetical protein FQR65_LT04413 [Abscondita terminalis]